MVKIQGKKESESESMISLSVSVSLILLNGVSRGKKKIFSPFNKQDIQLFID